MFESESAGSSAPAPAWGSGRTGPVGIGAAPGPGLAAVIAGVDLHALGGDGLAEVIAACERVTSWAQARQLAAITVLGTRMGALVGGLPDGPGYAVDAAELTVTEVAITLTVSETSAGNRVALAGRLADLPGTAAAFGVGVIDIGRVRAITEATEVLSRDAARAVEARVLGRAATQTAAQLRRSLGRAVYAVDPGAAAARHDAATAGRRVSKHALPDGIGGIWVEGPADGTVALHTALTILAARARERDRAAARAGGDPVDEPGMDARRFDALVAWAKAVIAHQDDALRPARDHTLVRAGDTGDTRPAAGGDIHHDTHGGGVRRGADPDGPFDVDAPDDVRDAAEVPNGVRDAPDASVGVHPDDPDPDDPGPVDRDEGGRGDDGRDHEVDDVDDSADYDAGRYRGVGAWVGAATVLDPDSGEVYHSAEVLIDPLTGAVHPRDPAPARPPRPGRGATALHVTVPAETLLGITEAPGELTGYGPIPAAMARRLAPGSIMRRLLTDPVTGALLDYGTSTYQVPAALAAHVATRDGTCRGPGCGRPAAGCDLDHTVPYPRGRTCAGNLGAACGHHHGFKTAGLWTLNQGPGGVFTVTTATGQRRTVHPADLREGLHLMREPDATGGGEPHTDATGSDQPGIDATDGREPVTGEQDLGAAGTGEPVTDEPDTDSRGRDPDAA